ncbi:MAG: hypothetical protein ABI343_01505, partial [Burkholderiaceae bacterium]
RAAASLIRRPSHSSQMPTGVSDHPSVGPNKVSAFKTGAGRAVSSNAWGCASDWLTALTSGTT